VIAIKPVLIVCFLALLAWAFRNRNRVGMRAGIKVVLVLLTAFAVTAIADPGLTQSLAHAVGVADGADLLLYALVVSFACTTMAAYFRFRSLESRLAQVVREQAITDAVVRDGPPGAAMPAAPPATPATPAPPTPTPAPPTPTPDPQAARVLRHGGRPVT